MVLLDNMDYNSLTTEQLEEKSVELTEEFNQYKAIWCETYIKMLELGKENDKIKNIIKKRNGK